MNNTLIEEFRSYERACSSFASELGQVIADLKFEARGGKLWYAVDSSELVAYVTQRSKSDGMVLFDDSTGEQSKLIDSYTLNRIFFRTPGLLLLPSYGVEVEALALRLREGEFKNLAEQIPAMWDALELLESEDAQSITNIVFEAEQSERKLTIEELDHIVLFFQENAGALWSLVDEGYSEAMQRLHRVFRHAEFVEFGAIVDVVVQDNDEVLRRWFYKLKKRRRGRISQSFMDAMAVASVFHGNEALRQSNQKILLISRSTDMARVFQEEMLQGLWRGAGEDVFRHPRIFSAFHRPEDLPADEAIRQLTQRRSSLELFLKSASRFGARVTRESERGELEVLKDTLEDVRKKWHDSQTLTVGSLTQTEMFAPVSHQKLLDFVRMIGNRQEFVERVEARLLELSQMFDRDNEFLGWLLPSHDKQGRRIIENEIAYEGLEAKAVLRCTLESMPYTLQFFAPELKQRARGFEGRWNFGWREALDFFREGFSVEHAYERLLSMAFILGSLGHWNLAKEYCRRALQEPEEAELPVPRHEGYFFLAVCYRKIRDIPLDDLPKAFEALSQATSLKRKEMKDESYEDPRYLKERGTLMMYHNWRTEENRYPDEDILGFFERAASFTVDDLKLKAQILNNICYLYAEQVDVNAKALEDSLSALELFLNQHVEIREWPASMIDTIVWAGFRLGGDKLNVRELKSLCKRLEAAMRRLQPGDEEGRGKMKDHQRVIQKALAAAEKAQTS